MSEGNMIRNEFIEVHVNEATGGIARIKQFGRKPNRLSQQLAFRFPRERTPRVAPGTDQASQERTFYSDMRCSSIAVTSSGPAMGEIVTAGTLFDPEDGSKMAEFSQTVRLWRGRPIIELEIELRPLRLPDGDPWSNYFASRFAWNDSTATLTRSVLGGATASNWSDLKAPISSRLRRKASGRRCFSTAFPFTARPGRGCSTASWLSPGKRPADSVSESRSTSITPCSRPSTAWCRQPS